MFQSFKTTSDPSQARPRLAKLRTLMADEGLDALLVPRADQHQGEYVAPCSERLAWITGFTGSAGAAVILKDRAVLFVDGRYTVQAVEQTDPALFEVDSLVDNPPREWMKTNLFKGAKVGFDPWLHTVGEVRALQKALAKAGASAIPLKRNLIDAVWEDRPDEPVGPVIIHPLKYAGVAAEEKLQLLAGKLKAEGVDHTVLTDPASLAWTFNIRGSDVPHTPLALGFVILSATGKPKLFLDERKLDQEAKTYLSGLAELHAPSALTQQLAVLAKAGTKVGLDENLAADLLREVVEENGGTVVHFADPAALPRAMKNETELAGTRAAHVRDGAALAEFLAWLDAQEAETLTEIKVVEKLEAIRVKVGEAMQMPLKDISFGTICGAGPNAALPHYRVTEQSNRKSQAGELLLVDSGGQFFDGTTDVTRTVAIGQPTEEMRKRFTLVLKGMIAISLLRFPEGTRGADIDAFARKALWRNGLDYNHGTGHGVGSYLSVHEGPQRIAKTGVTKLAPGMILSNEPGYYKPGHYGIRIENLIVVSSAESVEGGDIPMHSFETITLAPIDRRLIEPSLLTEEERAWLNAYHRRVYQEISPLVDADTAKWLEQATAVI